MKTRNCVVGMLLALLALAAHAQAVDAPKVHRQGGSTYVTGGIGEAQRNALFRIANRYPIQLIFEVEGRKDDISGVKVTLTDLAGNVVIEAVSAGPYFYISPPADGRFTIDAEYHGEKQTLVRDLVGRRYLVLEVKFHAH